MQDIKIDWDMLIITSEQRILAYREPVDMRKSFNGLVEVTQSSLKEDPLSGDLYIFRNKRGNYLKILKWDRNGYVLYCKRLERGKFKILLDEEKQILNPKQLPSLSLRVPVNGISYIL